MKKSSVSNPSYMPAIISSFAGTSAEGKCSGAESEGELQWMSHRLFHNCDLYPDYKNDQNIMWKWLTSAYMIGYFGHTVWLTNAN